MEPPRAGWEERATLKDGTGVVVRPLLPSDREMLVRGFAELSAESRLRRFFMEKDRLSDAELSYLTQVDGERHLAIAAALADDPGTGVGIARCVRVEGEPDVAEPAVAVIDAFQGRGLGRILLHRLEAEAWSRGIRRFRALVLARNAPMLSLLGQAPPVAMRTVDDECLEVEIELHPPHAEEEERSRGPLYRLMTMTARGVVELLRRR